MKPDLPGNSVKEVGDSMKGGAVREDKSPEKDVILYIIVNRSFRIILIRIASKGFEDERFKK
jgi:hypothetical protein